MATFIIYKPYQMLSQFTKEAPHHVTLNDLAFRFPQDVYPIGRLDADSEGLLLLSNDKSLNAKLLHPRQKQAKTYWVQVEGSPTVQDLQPLKTGVTIRIKGKNYKTQPAKVFLLKEKPDLPLRNPPIRVRQSIPDTWVSITLTEGKNRQVRRMFAAIGFPVLRLVRVGIGNYFLGKGILADMKVGMVLAV